VSTGAEHVQPGLYAEAVPWPKDMVTTLFIFPAPGTARVLHAGWMTEVCSVVGIQRLARAPRQPSSGAIHADGSRLGLPRSGWIY